MGLLHILPDSYCQFLGSIHPPDDTAVQVQKPWLTFYVLLTYPYSEEKVLPLFCILLFDSLQEHFFH